MMCFKILITAGKMKNSDVGAFLKAGAAEDIRSVKPKPTGPAFNWLIGLTGDKIWLNIIAISKHCFNDGPVANFRDLPDIIQKNPVGWQGLF